MARMTKEQQFRIAMEKNIKQMEETMKNQPSPIASFISCTGEEYEKIRQQRKAHPGIEAVEPDDLMTVSFQLPLASVMELDKLAAVHDEIRVTMLRKIVEAYLRDHHGDLEDAEEAVD